MEYTQAEILQTVAMTEMEHLDIRTVTLSLSLRDCASFATKTNPNSTRAVLLTFDRNNPRLTFVSKLYRRVHAGTPA